MEFEFDKEIDALLRQTARNGGFVSNQSAAHLDADEISAFAENVLPEKTKQRYTIHLADCDKCRKSLSNIILLNSETQSEAVQAEEKQFATSPIPWYRKLFVFPNLAYTMGALVLLFSGIGVYTVLQNVGDSRNAEVSQTYDKQPNGKGMSSDGDATASESFSSNSAAASNTMMSNAASMNSASNSAANVSTAPSGLTATANSNAAGSRTEADKDMLAQPKPVSPPKETVVTDGTSDTVVTSGPPAPPPPAPARENEYPNLGEVSKQQNETQNSIAQNQTQIMPDSRNVQRAPVQTMRAEEKSRKLEESRDDASGRLKASPKKSAPKNDATNVGGKTFNRENNVWYDSAYRGQTTVNVSRGTNEYKKLDSGLRAIAENLGGTVVVVWKQKAYRIQ